MPVKTILGEICRRYQRIRAGLDVGFDDPEISSVLASVRGGSWRTVPAAVPIAYENAQFEVVVINGDKVSRELVREANRVLKPEGCMFFTVPAKTRHQAGYTAPEVYRLIREGFDILSVQRPAWWKFGREGYTLTVVARKKAWRDHKGFIRDAAVVMSPFSVGGNR